MTNKGRGMQIDKKELEKILDKKLDAQSRDFGKLVREQGVYVDKQIEKQTKHFDKKFDDQTTEFGNIVNAVSEGFQHQIKVISEGHNTINKKLDKLIKKVDEHDKRLESLEMRLAKVQEDVEDIKERIGMIDGELQIMRIGLDTRVSQRECKFRMTEKT